ncbi:MAG: C69 family dipeptidase [Prevotellaceae bacterium]|nr:C69 family dipeptidase [Prevotellaceae bacterium]
MKRIITFSMALMAIGYAMACTNLIVGKNASKDGSVIVSYNADSYGMYGNLYHRAAGTHLKGEVRKVFDWDTNRYLGVIDEAEVTYNVVGQMNENQVSVTETTFGGREELADSTGGIDYGSLIYVALERSKTAREAIKVMTDLVAKYGYYSEGESFSICDKNEAWIMEMVGKGAGSKGAVWVAVRIPDDCISAHANQSRITKFLKLYDKKDVLYSKDVIKFAREKGYFNGPDKEFSFRDAYAPCDFSANRYCEARVWSFFNKHVKGMEKYLSYVKGTKANLNEEMPLYVKPDEKVSVKDIKNDMRDHYEGTALDITKDLGAGGYDMPYRPSPLSKKVKVDGKDVEVFNERPISTQQTSFGFVGQMRSWLPDGVGGIVWWTNDDTNMAVYTPIYCCVENIPECYQMIEGVQDAVTFNWKSAFWLENTVANMVYPYYSKMFPDLLKVRNELEDKFDANLPTIEEAAAKKPELMKVLLATTSKSCVDEMMKRWKELFEYLVVKHNDMVIKKETDGKFATNQYGFGSKVERPGYSDAYWNKVLKETGDKYIMDKQ